MIVQGWQPPVHLLALFFSSMLTLKGASPSDIHDCLHAQEPLCTTHLTGTAHAEQALTNTVTRPLIAHIPLLIQQTTTTTTATIPYEITGMPMSYLSRLFDNFHTVEPNVLYRSKQLDHKKLKRYILKYHIKSIINLRGKNENARWWQKEHAVAKETNTKIYDIPMNARTLSTKENIDTLLRLYKDAPRPILIHCKSGTDRTGEAAALWKLEQQKTSKKQAFKQLSMRYGYIKRRRPAKYFLINIWQNYEWFTSSYDNHNYPLFA